MFISCKTCDHSIRTENKGTLKCMGLCSILFGKEIQIEERAAVRELRQTYKYVLVKENFYCKFYDERPPKRRG